MKIKTTKKRQVFTIFLIFCLTISALTSCRNPSPANKDGEILSTSGKPDRIFASPEVADSSEGIVLADKKSGGAESGSAPLSDDQQGEITYRPGVLTGSEWRDNDHWQFFTGKLNAQENGWYDIAATWSMYAAHRLHVRLRSDTHPVSGARVVLYDSNNTVLWSAVSDNAGNAYLFWDLDPANPTASPTRVEVTGADGQILTVNTTTLADAITDGTLELSMSAAASAKPSGLDLMLMVDTTGSMSDELEYLKAELEDVVCRVEAQSQLSVRTSVNFYRDEGDEYVVRYFRFHDDISETVANINAQSADGGGDYPEAVHTALANGVYDHAWEKDAIKIMILVLDAPPHEDAEVIASLSATLADAAAKGIRIIPVASSGVDTTCQVLFRTYAALTGGTYTFLTDHSGVGNPHELPDVEEIHVELLNDMLVRIITGYCE